MVLAISYASYALESEESEVLDGERSEEDTTLGGEYSALETISTHESLSRASSDLSLPATRL